MPYISIETGRLTAEQKSQLLEETQNILIIAQIYVC